MLKRIKQKVDRKFRENARMNSYILAAYHTNNQTFTKYKNVNDGKEVVICGAGPTFKKYIPLKGVLHVALNRALLNEKIKFDYFIADDYSGISFMLDYLEKYNCTKFLGHQTGVTDGREIPESFARKAKAERYYSDSFMVKDGYDSVPVVDINYLPVGNMPNIALAALQIVLFTNPKRIYLVGCDASSSGHYNEKGISEELKNIHEKDLKMAVSTSNAKVIECWQRLKLFIEVNYPDVEIVSVNPVGLKGLFKDCYQDENGELKFEKI